LEIYVRIDQAMVFELYFGQLAAHFGVKAKALAIVTPVSNLPTKPIRPCPAITGIQRRSKPWLSKDFRGDELGGLTVETVAIFICCNATCKLKRGRAQSFRNIVHAQILTYEINTRTPCHTS
jgi:hypothetical protein